MWRYLTTRTGLQGCLHVGYLIIGVGPPPKCDGAAVITIPCRVMIGCLNQHAIGWQITSQLVVGGIGRETETRMLGLLLRRVGGSWCLAWVCLTSKPRWFNKYRRIYHQLLHISQMLFITTQITNYKLVAVVANNRSPSHQTDLTRSQNFVPILGVTGKSRWAVVGSV